MQHYFLVYLKIFFHCGLESIYKVNDRDAGRSNLLTVKNFIELRFSYGWLQVFSSTKYIFHQFGYKHNIYFISGEICFNQTPVSLHFF